LFFASCIVLVAAVLLQPGKTDAGALFTSNVSSSAFGPRGTATVLSKITIVAACVFMLSALMISMPALTGSVSVLSTATETTVEEEAPAVNANSVDANANAAPPAANANDADASGVESGTDPAAASEANTDANANK
jgi:preprotein translocase subunit SecG